MYTKQKTTPTVIKEDDSEKRIEFLEKRISSMREEIENLKNQIHLNSRAIRRQNNNLTSVASAIRR